MTETKYAVAYRIWTSTARLIDDKYFKYFLTLGNDQHLVWKWYFLTILDSTFKAFDVFNNIEDLACFGTVSSVFVSDCLFGQNHVFKWLDLANHLWYTGKFSQVHAHDYLNRLFRCFCIKL